VKNVPNDSWREKWNTYFMFGTICSLLLQFSGSLNKSNHAYISDFLCSTITIIFWWHPKPQLYVFSFIYMPLPLHYHG
jgi:hypothetical protein